MREIYKQIKEKIINFTTDPIGVLAFLTPLVIVLISFISGIVAYIRFIVSGGYITQIDYVKEEGFFGNIEDRFLKGTTGDINSGIIGKIILILVLIELILLIVSYFRDRGMVRKIVMIVDLILIIVQGVLTIKVFFKLILAAIHSIDAFEIEMYKFEGITSKPVIDVFVYVVISIIAIGLFVIMLLTSKQVGELFRHTIKMGCVVYIGIPLGFVVLQNIITIFASVIGIGLCGVIIFILFSIFFGETSGNPNYECSGDSIYTRNEYGDKVYVCSIKAYERGESKIVHNGERVTDVGGCKKPRK